MKLIRKFNVQTRLLVALLCVSIIPAVFIGVYANKVYTDMVAQELSDYTVNTIQHMDAELNGELRLYTQFIDQVSVEEDVQSAMKTGRSDIALRRSIERYLIRTGYFKGLRVIDASGESLYDDGFIRMSPQDLDTLISRVDAASPSDIIYRIGTDYGGDLVLGRKIYSYPQGQQHIGYIFAFINDSLPHERVFNRVNFGDGSVMLMSSDGTVMAGSSGNSEAEFDDANLYAQLLDSPGKPSFTANVGGVPSFVVFSQNQKYGSYLLVTIPLSHIHEGSSKVQRQLIILVIITMLLCVGLSIVIYRSVATPINKIIANCKGGEPYIDDSPDEIGFLARTIDSYTADLQSMSQMHALDQRRKRELELEALQYQINPHFLFNTLGTLKWVAVINDAPSIISEGISSLSQLLNSVLMNKNEMVTLREELDNLSHYFTIQRIRYADSFKLVEDIDQSLLDCLIPRFILQPLAENAVLHGASGLGRQILITLRCQRTKEGVLLEIRDDGSGFDTSIIHDSSAGKFSGIGLSNVDERLRLYFGEGHGLEVVSSPGHGTICRVIIPGTAQEDQNV